MFKSTPSRLAQPTILPDYDRPFGLPAFNSIEDAIAAYDGDDAIYALYPKRIEEAAKSVLGSVSGQNRLCCQSQSTSRCT